ncbi:MAG TPA: aminopeptidase, partial [Longimicrobiales bacterium]|nr:aminopeptidase [Longimicrobiales bacterium]
EFFCTRPGGGPDTVWCGRAQARWRDTQRFSVFLDGFVAELEALYADSTLDSQGKVAMREAIFREAQDRFRTELAPSLESLTFASFADLPLNNATLLSRVRYYHRLPDFQALLESSDGLREAVEAIRVGVPSHPDPFSILPRQAP